MEELTPSPLLLLIHEDTLGHDTGPGHPERPERQRAILDQLNALGLELPQLPPSEATREHLARVHTDAHIERVLAARGRHVALDPDTPASPGSVRAALLAAGGAVEAVDRVMRRQAHVAWSLARPPGHHAEADQVMGYCIFNNVAVAAAHALAAWPDQVQRVLIVDWDVHHGNGTQHLFEDDPRVLFFDLHQDEHYPEQGDLDERGVGPGLGTTWNVPLRAGAGRADYLAALDRLLPARFAQHQPALVLVSAGFDPHRDDPLGDMTLTPDDFAQLAARVRHLAQEHAQDRMVLVLEGGYDLDGLSQSVARVARALHTREPVQALLDDELERVMPSTWDTIAAHERWTRP